METGLNGKNALILASSRGLGLGIAKSLAAEGANIIITGRTEKKLITNIQDINKMGSGSAHYYCMDFTSKQSVEMILDFVVRTIGGVDILINNTGGPPPGGTSKLDTRTLENQFENMVKKIIAITTNSLPNMIKKKWGRIITIGSSGVLQPIDNLALSNIVRSSLVGWSKSLSNEVAQYGVTVNMLLPGRIATERLNELDSINALNKNKSVEEIREESRKQIPAKRYGTVEEFASVATFLASDAASYITGSQIRCDGGLIRSV